MYAHAIAQVEPLAKGIHLIWVGPRPWVYSPGGWFIQRRRFHQTGFESTCEDLTDQRIADLRFERETQLSFGTVTLRDGLWPESVLGTGLAPPQSCDVIRLELNELQVWVQIEVVAQTSFAFALREGKVVAVAGGPVAGSASFTLRAVAIDAVEVYVRGSVSIRLCIRESVDPQGWQQEPFIVSNLQLPIQELMPSLTGPNDEFAAGQSRLLSGETLNQTDFNQLANTIRAGVTHAGPPRPIDEVLLLRNNPAASFEELAALDPIRVLVSHPKWRRVLGFGWFDNDPNLAIGQTYEYRITGFFPSEDLSDTVYGFHTIPSQTALPAEFYLNDLRLRLPQPTIVELAPGTPTTGLIQISRRGIQLRPQNQNWWLIPSPGNWSLVIDFPAPVSSLILEVDNGHSLEFTWGNPWNLMNLPVTVPSGPNPRLDFPFPINQLRLSGTGFLYSIRIPAGPVGLKPVSIDLLPVALVNTPLPEPPLSAKINNLQRPQPVMSDDQLPATLPSRHALGFEVEWRPSLQAGLTVWPADQQAAPPIDAALYQVEHRQPPASNWDPLLTEENWTLGDRISTARNTLAFPGVDLMTLFPEIKLRPQGGELDLRWRDVFDFQEGGNVISRPVPPPGSIHQYRVRAVDLIGRPSLTYTLTNILPLEKHIPPPLPVGPDETPADSFALPAPTGVQARVLVRDAPDLTPDDLIMLGTDDNLIILSWGWHQSQRDLDPFTTEFRVYVANQPLDSVTGALTSVATISPGVYDATLNLARPVVADAAKGSSLQAGYPFYIRTHTSGLIVTARIEARVPGPNGSLPVPTLGPILLPLHLTPDLTRPLAWTERVEVKPLKAGVEYVAMIRNRLTVTTNHPRDTIWVGVSAADDQPYVPDQLAPVETRPGNESAIVPVICEGRYYGRPRFGISPALDPVPVLRTPEPEARPILFSLDLRPYLVGAGLAAGDLIRPERCSADTVFAAYDVSSGNHILGRVIDPRDSSEIESEVIINNPSDQAAIIAQLNDTRTSALEDRFVVFLADSHPYRDRLFEPVTQQPVPYGAFQETLPVKGGRYVYRVRKCDAAGHLSAGSAVAKVIVRVPSLSPGAAPERAPSETGDSAGALRLKVAPDPELTYLLAFSQVISITNGTQPGPIGEAELLRVPNAHDHYPNNGIRLRAPDGAILAPQVKALSDSDITTDADGSRRVAMTFNAGAGERVRVWVCSLTSDGMSSLLAGPWSLVMPLAPLPVPFLTVSGAAPDLSFTWSWPPGPTFNIAIEQSLDGANWQRVSPLLPETASAYAYSQSAGTWHYRLRVISPDGRTAQSNTVTV